MWKYNKRDVRRRYKESGENERGRGKREKLEN